MIKSEVKSKPIKKIKPMRELRYTCDDGFVMALDVPKCIDVCPKNAREGERMICRMNKPDMKYFTMQDVHEAKTTNYPSWCELGIKQETEEETSES